MQRREARSVGGQLVGIGLRLAGIPEFLARRPSVRWVEVHPENCLRGAVAARALASLRSEYDVSLHGVGLSLGSAEGVQRDHLARLVALNAQLDPRLVSDHLAWTVTGDQYLDALLPLPYTEESLDVVCRNIQVVQDALGRRILIENIAAYLRFVQSEISEPAFLMELVRRTGCGILCDITNLFISCRNFGLDPIDYLQAIHPAAVSEIHLSGHSRIRCGDRWLLFDDHRARVGAAVWTLYGETMCRYGPKPTLIEWDTHVPSLDVLLDEALHADEIMANFSNRSETAG
jgi:uncharacterized protein (UPF0276 family)